MKTEAETGVTQLGTLRITGSSQELGESPGGQLSPSEFLEESMEDQLAPLTPSFWTSGLSNCEGINLCCFQPLCLWFVTAPPGNECCLQTRSGSSRGNVSAKNLRAGIGMGSEMCLVENKKNPIQNGLNK